MSSANWIRNLVGKKKHNRLSKTEKPKSIDLLVQALEDRTVPATITGGTGPGGIESIVTSSAILYYLDPSTGVTTSGSNVTAWNSQSTGGRNFTQGTAANQPTLQATAFAANSLPGIRFDGTDDRVTLSTATTAETVIIVNQSTATSASLNGIWGSDNPSDKGIRLTNTTTWSNPGDANDFVNGTNGGMFVNGSATGSFGAVGATHVLSAVHGTSTNAYNTTQLGWYFSGRVYKGDIGDVVAYNRRLISSERIIIENALASKYGVTLGANDFYAGDTGLNGDYDRNVFGIGRVAAGNQVLTSGQAGFGIEATSIADDGDYVLAGHKVATNSFTAAGVPSGVARRFSRSWYVDVTDANNNLGATLAFDYSDAGLAIGTADTFTLLRSLDGGTTWTSVGVAPTVTGDQINFTLSSAELSTALYTLGDATRPSIVNTAGNINYAIGAPAAAVDATITVTTGGNPTLAGATVSVVGFVNGDADVLALTDTVGGLISGSYNSTNGVLTLSGSTTAANYQTALRSVTFSKATYQATSSRVINFAATDASALTGTGSRTIIIQANASANTIQWDGNSDADGDGVTWSDPLNWAGDLAPDSNDIALFAGLDTGAVNVTSTTIVGAISFTNNAAPYTISGSPLQFTAGANVISQSGTTSNSISNSLSFIGGSLPISVAPATTLTLSGNISGTGNLDKNSGGILALGGSNSYTGATNVNGGTLRVIGAAAPTQRDYILGSGTFGLPGYSPLSFWEFNQASGTAAPDSGATNTTGTLTGAATRSTGRTGAAGVDYALDTRVGGTVTTVVGTQYNSINSNDKVTLGFWLFQDPTPGPRNNTTFQALNASGGRVVFTHAHWSDHNIYWDAGSGGANTYERINTTVPFANYTDGWHHYILTKSSSGPNFQAIYRDGVQIVSGAGSQLFGDITSLIIAPDFRGQMDDVFLLNTALTATDVTNLWNSRSSTLFGNAIPDASAVTLAPGTFLDLANTNETIGSLSGSGTVTSSVAGAVTLSTGGNNTSTTFSGIIQNGSGTMALTKTGTGTMTLSGANTYSGLTDIQNGTIQLGAGNDRLPIAGTVNIGATAVLDLNNFNQTLGGLTGTGKVVDGANDATLPTLTLNILSGTVTVTNILGDAGRAGFHFSKIGAGTLALSGTTSQYTGKTAILAGTLSIAADAALGVAPGGFVADQITIANNSTLLSSAALTLNANRGITLGTGGGRINTAAVLTYAGRFAGGTGLNKDGASDLILSNTAAGQTPGNISINTGRLFFTDQNTLGTGAISIANSATLAKIGGSPVVSLTNAINQASGGNISNRGGNLTLTNLTMPTNNGTAIFNNDDQPTNVGLIIVPGNQTLTSTLTVQVGGNNASVGSVRLDGIISGANLTKTQVGTLTLTNGASNYTGTTNINAGTLQVTANGALGAIAGGTTVASGATLAFDGTFNYSTLEPITIIGAGVGGVGAISKTNGSTTLSTPITMAGSATIGSGASATLTINPDILIASSRTLSYTGAGNIVMVGSLTAPPTSSLDKLNTLATGDYSFTAASQTFNARVDNVSGTSWLLIGRGREGWQFDTDGQGLVSSVNQNLGTSAAFAPALYSDAIVNDLLVQSGINPANVEVRLRRATNAAGTAWQEARWRSFTNTSWTSVFSNPGTDTNSGGLPATLEIQASALSGAQTYVGLQTRDAGDNDGRRVFTWGWSGHAGQRGFSYGSAVNLVSGPSATNFLWESGGENHEIPYTEIYVRSLITGPGNVIKNGTGTLTLQGTANSYTGTTTINAGALVAAHSTALGTATGGTNVFSGGTLALTGGVTISEALTISGSGAAGQPGALVNVAGNNQLTSNITAVEATIGSTAGTLTLSGTLETAVSNLTFGGAGNVVVNSTISATALPLSGVTGELEIWLDATDVNGDNIANNPANGSLITTWVDKSGRGRNFDSALGDPNLVTSSTHGQPAINFDGDDALRTNLTTNNPRNFIDGNGEFTLISVARYSGADRERVIAAVSSHNWLFGFHGGSSNNNGHYDGWGSQNPAPVGASNDTNWHLHANQMNVFSDVTNPAGDWWRDGVRLTDDSRGTGDGFANNVPDGLSLGAWNGLGESSTSEVSELLMYNRVLSDAELNRIQAYLNAKYSLGFPVSAVSSTITKNGTGTVTLMGNNSFAAPVVVNAGTLVAGHNNALGTAAAGVTVNSGASLALTQDSTSADITITGEALAISGTGAAGQPGVLVNLLGSNTIAASSPITTPVVSLGQVAIGAAAGSLTINSPIDLKSSRLIVNGAGNTTINGAISGTGVNVGGATPENVGALTGVFTNVAEASNYILAYEHTNIPNNVNGANPFPYTRNNTATIQPFDRIAYYLELQTGAGALEYVYVSMNAFTANINQIGIPNAAAPWKFQQTVSNMNVFSNRPTTGAGAITTGTGLSTGNIEIWPSNYSQPNTIGIPNANGGTFDFGDGGSDTSNGYGSFQVHNYDIDGAGSGTAGQVLLAYNNWRSTSGDLGIGTRTTADPDWTFSNSLTTYSVKRLAILVRETTSRTIQTDNSLVKNGTGILTLGAAAGNSYNGTTTINDGTLLANNTTGSATGPGNISGNNTAVFGGTGVVAGTVTLANAARIAPGVAVESLTTGSFTGVGTNFFDAELAGVAGAGVAGGHDILVVNGSVSLGSMKLALTGALVPNPAVAQTFTIIDNDTNTDPVIGSFTDTLGNPLPEGSAILFNGQYLFISYVGGDGNDVVLSSQLQGSDAIADTIIVTPVSATSITYQLNGGTPVTLTGITEFAFNGLGKDDYMRVDVNGNALPSGGVFFNGGTQDFTSRPPGSVGDILRVSGTVAAQTATYTPSATTMGNGVVAVSGGGTVTFTGLEPVDITGMATATLLLPGANDVISLTDGVDAAFGSTAALVVSGTSGGVTIENARFFSNANVVIDTTTSDGNDTVTVNSGTGAHANTNLVITTGTGTDAVNVPGSLTVLGAISISSQSIAFTGGTLTSGAASTVTLNSGTGAISTSGTGVDIVAQALSATATTGIDIDTAVTNITASNTGAGSITIDETNGANILNVAAANGSATVRTATGNLNVSVISASTTVFLTATAGAITDGNVAVNNITAVNVALSASTGIGAGDAIETTTSNLEAGSAAGGIFLVNTGNLAIGNVSGSFSGVQAASGNIDIAASGSLSVITTGETVSAGGGTITLAANGSGSDLTAASADGPNIGASGAIVLSAGRDTIFGLPTVSFGDTYSNTSLQVTAGRDFLLQGSTYLDVNAAGTLTVNAGRDINLPSANPFGYSRLSTRGGAISLTAGRDFIAHGGDGGVFSDQTIDSTQLGAAPAGANITITAQTLSIRDQINAGTAGILTMTATTGAITDTNPTDNLRAIALGIAATAVTGVTLGTATPNFEGQTATGGITVNNAGALGVGNVTGLLSGVDVTGASGDISLVATGSINVISFDEDISGPANITLDAQGATSDITTSGSNSVSTIRSTGASSLVSLTAGQDVNIGLPNPQGYGDTLSAGNILVTAGRDFVLRQDSYLDVNGPGTNTVNAGRDIILFNDASNSRLTTRGGVITLTANRNVSLDVHGFVLNTIDSTQGGAVPAGANVFITATTGSISLGDGVSAGTAGNVILSAVAGAITDIRIDATSRVNGNAVSATAASGITLETAVNTVTTATTSAAGNISIAEADAVTLTNVSSTNGTVIVTAGGAMTATTVSGGGASGAVRLLTTAGDVLLGGVSATGAVRLDAAGAVTDNNAAAVNVTAAQLSIQAGAGIGAAGAIETSVGTIAAAAGGTIQIVNSGAVAIDSVTTFSTTLSGVASINNFINLGIGGTLSVNQPINAGTGVNAEIRLNLAAGVNQTAAGNITGTTLGINAAGAVNLGTATTNDVATFGATNSASGATVTYRDANNVALDIVPTGSNDVGYVAGTMAIATTSGLIDIDSVAGGITVVKDLDTTPGTGGTLVIGSNVTINSGVNLNVGGANIELDGFGVLDIIFTGPTVINGNAILRPSRNIVVRTGASVTGNGNLGLQAGYNQPFATDVGGLWVQTGGFVTATGTLLLEGRGFYDNGLDVTPSTNDGVIIDGVATSTGALTLSVPDVGQSMFLKPTSPITSSAGSVSLTAPATILVGDTTVNAGGSITVSGTIDSRANLPRNLVLNAATVGDVAVLGAIGQAASTTAVGDVTLTGVNINTLGIATAGGNTIVATNTGAGAIVGAVSGALTTFTKNGVGSLTLSGGTAANTFTGQTTVNDGALILAKANLTTALAGPIVIGDGNNNSQPLNVKTAILRIDASEQIVDTSSIMFVGNDGRLFLTTGNTETITTPTTFAQGDVKIAGALITTNAYAQDGGTTTLWNGSLRVGAPVGMSAGGTLDSSLAATATLQGSGTIYTNILTTNGTIDPSSGATDADFGNASRGTLTIRGNLQMTASSATNLDVASTGSDQLNVGINTALPLPAGSYSVLANYDLDPYLRGDVATVTEQARRGINNVNNANGTVRFNGTLNTRPIVGSAPLANNVAYGNSMNFVWRALNLTGPTLDPKTANLTSVPSDFTTKNSRDVNGVLLTSGTRFDQRYIGSAGQLNAVGQSVGMMTKFAGVDTAILTAPAYLIGQAKAMTLTSLTSSAVVDATQVKVTKQVWNAMKDSHTRVTLTVGNTSTSTITGPFYVELVGVPSGAVVFNAAGKRPSTGKPYLVVPAASLAPGASVTMEVDLLTPFALGKYPTLTAQVLRGGMP